MNGTPRLLCWDGKTQMAWTYDDGGRAAAGFKGIAGDCVCRAVAIATGKPYREVYSNLNFIGKFERIKGNARRSSARNGVHKPTTRRFLEVLGWHWHPTMAIGKGTTVTLCEDDLPAGRIIVSVSRHLVAVIDHVVHDTGDPQRATLVSEPGKADRIARRCVYGYYNQST